MEDAFTFADLLTSLSPLLLLLWLWAAWRVWQDLQHASRPRPGLARCGLPREPLGPSPLALLLRRGRRAMARSSAA